MVQQLSPWTKSSMQNDIKQNRMAAVKAHSAKFLQKPTSGASGATQKPTSGATEEQLATGTNAEQDDDASHKLAARGRRTDEEADPDTFSDDDVDGAEPMFVLPTRTISPEHCVISGLGPDDLAKGLRVKDNHEFGIQAHSTDGAPMETGGGAFFAAIRGAARVRARVMDAGDGSYTVQWRPPLSGEYTISVSLFGLSLPGSPFRVVVHGPQPHAPLCEVRGESLHQIVSRATHSFEIRYRDHTGGVAQATELDVFVLPDATYVVDDLPPTGSWDVAPDGSDAATGEHERASNAVVVGAAEHGVAPPTLNARPPSPWEAATRHKRGADESVAGDHSESVSGAGEPASKQPFADRVRVGKAPLIVRAEAGLSSEQIGLLMPGQLVNVVSVERDAPSGTVRACVTFEDELQSSSVLQGGSDEEWHDETVSGSAVAAAAAATTTPTAGTDGDVVGSSSDWSALGGGRGGSLRNVSHGPAADGATTEHFRPDRLLTERRAKDHLTVRGQRRLSHVGGGYTLLEESGEERRMQLRTRLSRELGWEGGLSDDGSDAEQSIVSCAAASSIMLSTDGRTQKMGWVTAKKDGKMLVSRHWRLNAGERLEHMTQWQRACRHGGPHTT